jgi:hypothetical protein
LFIRTRNEIAVRSLQHVGFAMTSHGSERAGLQLESDQMAFDGTTAGRVTLFT